MLECSTGESLIRTALTHHEDQGHNASRQCVILNGVRSQFSFEWSVHNINRTDFNLVCTAITFLDWFMIESPSYFTDELLMPKRIKHKKYRSP